MFYTGIGSRKTPYSVCQTFTKLAKCLENRNYVLRSGGAIGADQAFEDGCSNKEIYVPWSGFNNKKLIYPIPLEAFKIAQRFHVNWDNLSNQVKILMARNILQILGKDLNTPSEFVICWTPDGCYKSSQRTIKTGGTGLAIDFANSLGIPVYNLRRKNHLIKLLRKLDMGYKFDGKTIPRFIHKYSFLSNFYLVQIEYDGLVYPSIENAFQAAKFTKEAICSERNIKTGKLEEVNIRELFTRLPPALARTKGRSFDGLRTDWELVKVSVMTDLVSDKFKDPVLKKKLIDTSPMILEEGNHWGDVYWGVCNGVGENKLGNILMDLRFDLIENSNK